MMIYWTWLATFTLIIISQPNSIQMRYDLHKEWDYFKDVHQKNYSTSNEELEARHIFTRNQKFIKQHNILHSKGLESFKVKVNHFADVPPTDVVQSNHLKLAQTQSEGEQKQWTPPMGPFNITFVDWRLRGAVGPVRIQGKCGACWAFSAAGTLESHRFLATGHLDIISVQQLMDCSWHEGTTGCYGGSMTAAYQYLINTKDHLSLDETYPYRGQPGECYANRISGPEDIPEPHVKSYCTLKSGDEFALEKAVALHGPVAIGINGGLPSFVFYENGIYYNKDCHNNLTDINHAVVVVGYGEENGQLYWLLKNTWSTSWGINGYMKLARRKNNQCGVATLASFPIFH